RHVLLHTNTPVTPKVSKVRANSERSRIRATPFQRRDDLLRGDPRRVTAHIDDTMICAEYSEQTGQLCLRQDGALLREWFPPHSWIAIASVAGGAGWGARGSGE